MGHAWGVKRDSIKFCEIESLYKGHKLTQVVPSKIFKSVTNLSVIIKDITVSLEFKPAKNLVNNNYVPLKIPQLYSRYNSSAIGSK